jgi:hypothetical protein
MSIPQRHADEPDGVYPTLVEFEPSAKQQPADLGDDYDPEAAIALLWQFSDEPSEDPEADWAEFLAFARAIDEDRGSGRKLFDQLLSE